MKKVLVAGASGVLGREILRQLKKLSFTVRGQIYSADKKAEIARLCDEVVVADLTRPQDLRGICEGVDIVLSTVGKSVSLFTNSPLTFMDLDFRGNLNLLEEARRAGVKRFVYVSIFGSETSPRLRQGWAQEMFAQNVMHYFPSCTIIKTVGTFSGLNDLLIMGKTGLVMMPGNGKPLTNAIHPHDLAAFCLEHLEDGPQLVNVGGPEIHTRNEMAEKACRATGCKATLNIPLWLVKPGLAVVRLLSQNLYDKLSFFTYITTHDMVAPQYGKLKFEDYLVEKGYL
ncbi:MAG: NAD(P)H-binding protein [Cyclobacteriaceae bacterium]